MVLESDNGAEYLSVYQLVNKNGHYWQYINIMANKREALEHQQRCQFFFENDKIKYMLSVLDEHFLDIGLATEAIERLFEE